MASYETREQRDRALDALRRPPAIVPSGGSDGVYVDAVRSVVQRLRAEIAAEIEQFADDDSDTSDAYRHAAMIAKGIPGA